MTPEQFRATVLDFDPALAIGETESPPADWYTEASVASLEDEAVFGRSWLFACRDDQVAVPGAWIAGRHGRLPWLVVRDEDGTLRAFHNSCRHRGSEVLMGDGCAAKLVCRYHGWSYGLDGRMNARTHLPPLQVAEWGPLVLINADPEAAAPDVLELDFGGLQWVARRSYDVGCNWKAFCDNYLDGGYHIAHVHTSLDAQLDMGSYRTELGGAWSVQTAGPGDVAERIGEGATYVFRYPSLMLNRYGPVLDTNVVIPLAPNRCRVLFDFWFDEGVLTDEAFVARSLEQSHVTQLEDIEISESVQVGTESPAFARGRYAPRLEIAIHHFHRLLAEDLRSALP
ncbi:MAG: aromatic ring-hydroxylating dioxygenase subunit alpha [Proteobacteria bacterium]|nr:aromatic ring-hydroxylating dioxygenase subunit alpha [Pseudomonadota bacterium]